MRIVWPYNYCSSGHDRFFPVLSWILSISEDFLYINVRERKRKTIHTIFTKSLIALHMFVELPIDYWYTGPLSLSLCTSGRCNSCIKQPANWSVNSSVHTTESWYYINSPVLVFNHFRVLRRTPTEIPLFLVRSIRCLKAVREGNLFLKEDVWEGTVSNGFEFRILDSLKARTWKARKCSMEFKTAAFGLWGDFEFQFFKLLFKLLL